MKIESNSASTGRSTPEVSTANPGAAWRAALERALMESLALSRAATQPPPARVGEEPALEGSQGPHLSLAQTATQALVRPDGQANGLDPERRGDAFQSVASVGLNGTGTEPVQFQAAASRASSETSRSAAYQPASGVPLTAVSSRGQATLAPLRTGGLVALTPSILSGGCAPLSLPAASASAPGLTEQDPVVAGHALEARSRTSVGSRPEKRPVGRGKPPPPARPYSPRLMQLAQSGAGYRVNVRDASLVPSQIAVVAQALFWTIDSTRASVSEVYLNGKRFLRPGDAADSGESPASLANSLPTED